MSDNEVRPTPGAKGVGKIVENALGPASENFGRELAPAGKKAGEVASKATHALLRTVSGVIWGYEQIQNWVEQKVAEKLEGVPEEKLTEPDPRIAGPAIEAMRFAGQDKVIQELFAQLIASDLQVDLKTNVHPSFVEIIKQMSSLDAKIFSFLSLEGSQLLISLRVTVEGRNFHEYPRWLSFGLNPPVSFDEMQKSLSSLDRLGLVEHSSIRFPARQEINDKIEAFKNSDHYKSFEEQNAGKAIHDSRTGIYITPLGKSFARGVFAQEPV